MNKVIYFLAIIGLATSLQAQKELVMVTLVSSGKEFKVPLKIAEQIEGFKGLIRKGKIYLTTISGEVVSEIADLMNMMAQNKNLTDSQLIDKAEKEISIHDNYAFAVAVKYLKFQPGIDLILKIYKKTGAYSLPSDDYAYYMKLIQEINPQAYEKLKQCEAVNGQPCIEITLVKEVEGVMQGSDETQGYPILVIDPGLKLWPAEELRKKLESYVKFYNEAPIIPAITATEQQNIMEIIKNIAPSLYELFQILDPTGADHIKRGEKFGPTNISVELSTIDGLPVIYLGSRATQIPQEELRFVIAHELGHYALEHLVKFPSVIPKESAEKKQRGALIKAAMKKASSEKRILKIRKKGQEITAGIKGQLPFEKTFQHAYSRQQEFEADRFAVIELGIPIDDALAWVNRKIVEYEEQKLKTPEKITFTLTHPLSIARKKQLEELRREVELNKERGRKPMQIDWEDLAVHYLSEMT